VAARLALLPLLRELHVERLKLEIAQNEQARPQMAFGTQLSTDGPVLAQCQQVR